MKSLVIKRAERLLDATYKARNTPLWATCEVYENFKCDYRFLPSQEMCAVLYKKMFFINQTYIKISSKSTAFASPPIAITPVRACVLVNYFFTDSFEQCVVLIIMLYLSRCRTPATKCLSPWLYRPLTQSRHDLYKSAISGKEC